jgi:16S rRNA pseudouridine516 synthase
MRLDKTISHAGWSSRAESKRYVKNGHVTVNGRTITDPEFDVRPNEDTITLNEIDIDYRPFYWLMMNKPIDILSATEDSRDLTVLSLLDNRYRRMGLFPMGRLDKDSTGLVVLTNDGQTAYRMLAPKNRIPKLYQLTVEGSLGEREVHAFALGITLADGTKLLPAKLEILESGLSSACQVTLSEGKYHQLKRMFGTLGFPVLSLHRAAIGGLSLDEALPPGGWRRMTDDEIAAIGNSARQNPAHDGAASLAQSCMR